MANKAGNTVLHEAVRNRRGPWWRPCSTPTPAAPTTSTSRWSRRCTWPPARASSGRPQDIRLHLGSGRRARSREHDAFPSALLSLPSAAVVDVNYNRLSGSLPDLSPPVVVGGRALPLQVLDVSSNFLAGRFPSVIWEPRLSQR